MELYYRDKSKPSMNKWNKLRLAGVIAEILGKERLCNLGFNIPRGKVTAEQAVILNSVEEELTSVSDIAKADDTELQETTENTARSMEDLIPQLDDPLGDSLEYPLCKLLGFGKALKSIWGLLKVEMEKASVTETYRKGKAQAHGNLGQPRI